LVRQGSSTCDEPGCNRSASYGFDGYRPIFCPRHKKPGLMDVVNRKVREGLPADEITDDAL
jgi:hypothetical protein